MKNLLFLLIPFFLSGSCQSGEQSGQTQDAGADVNKIEVLEVIQASFYTYLRAKHQGEESWFALPSTDVKTGETYYYTQTMEMKDFYSKDLKRNFKTIFFIEGLSASPITEPKAHSEPEPDHGHGHDPVSANPMGTGAGMVVEKVNIKMPSAKGVVSIGELYSKKKDFSGKSVSVRGAVVKFSPGIMNKNWVHLQDGTESGGKYDLTVTTGQNVAIGDTVTFEGKITVDKDLGAGYFFEVIMEDAVLK